jgi:CRISPR/Cas system-associated endonuclease Cas1
MRVVGEIPHSDCKIMIFYWNNRYLIKLEQGPFEQTYKIQEYDVASEDEVRRLVTEEFIQSALRRFEAMAQSLDDAIGKV